MLKMDQVHVLRHKVLNEGQSIRRVARELGLSRNTVAKIALAGANRSSRQARERPVWKGAAAARGAGGGVGAADHRQATPHGDAAASAARAEGYQVGRTLVGDYWRERRRQAPRFTCR